MLELTLKFDRDWFDINNGDKKTNFKLAEQTIDNIPFALRDLDIREIVNQIKREINYDKRYNKIWDSTELILFITIKINKSLKYFENGFIKTKINFSYSIIKNLDDIVLYAE